MQYKALSQAQRQHLEGLMAEIKSAEVAAQRFLGYCATEAGIEIGRDGWQFDLDQMAFFAVDSAIGFAARSDLHQEAASVSGNGDLHA
jgi:hypothetical protein